MNGGLEQLTSLFSSGGAGAGPFLGANATAEAIPMGTGDFAGAMATGNANLTNPPWMGPLGGALNNMGAGMGQEQQQMGMAPIPQMPGMMPMQAPPQGTPPRGGGQAPTFPALGKIDLQMAANLLKKRLGIQ